MNEKVDRLTKRLYMLWSRSSAEPYAEALVAAESAIVKGYAQIDATCCNDCAEALRENRAALVQLKALMPKGEAK